VAEQRFDVLKSLLSSAASMLQELVNNPLLERYLDVFARMPEGDREPLVGALEHEVQTRLLSQEVAQDFTQVELRPNPKAQFYLRVITPEQEAKVEMVPLLRAMYTMATGIDELDPHWLGLIGQALRQLDAGALEKLVSFNRAMQVSWTKPWPRRAGNSPTRTRLPRSRRRGRAASGPHPLTLEQATGGRRRTRSPDARGRAARSA
jgi:hypothetical protein